MGFLRNSFSKGVKMKINNLLKAELNSDYLETFGMAVLTGLSSNPKTISSKYFYDDEGSELFKRITEAPDYYVTSTEFSILKQLAHTLPALVGGETIDIIELGAGDGHKSKLLIDGFLDQHFKVTYYPIDISEQAMHFLKNTIQESPRLEIHGIVADYFTGLAHARSLSNHRQLVLFLGSNIGNFERAQSLEFLRRVWKSLNPDDFVLIGFDQKKDIEILNQAYNDSTGYTERFNLNLLTRINRELGGTFEVDQFKHYGFYNPLQGAMESHLVSLKEQSVFIRDLRKTFHFAQYEPIHLEYSFKFLPSDIDRLCHQTGFTGIGHFRDERSFFVDSLWKVVKNGWSTRANPYFALKRRA